MAQADSGAEKHVQDLKFYGLRPGSSLTYTSCPLLQLIKSNVKDLMGYSYA